ncbi:P-loop containing nucleoside triphosphate hydrolase protein [Calocera viscosa TUFC12733]|uniref:p-loop containing nucleoside triphosphate hydrolase protein n=1 Tax=Calocera viscosa (strain TUFC12733) TaxID=1330018 RepID=A0A167RF50_CALVF|nr:P-loop containing nucleoside triphosphate hydrolase protein [Calocera viscosa TUFC12733]
MSQFRLFWRQFWALTWKNYIILWQHPILNLIRAFILPIAYAAFLGVAQLLLGHQNNLGQGTPAPIQNLTNTFTNGNLAWVDATTNVSNQLYTPSEIMQSVTKGFSSYQQSQVVQLPTSDSIPYFCPENFNLRSTCFAGIVFNSVPSPDGAVKLNYTLRGDSGLINVDVWNHDSDYELRFFPLQWTIDSSVIELVTGVTPEAPLEWPFTDTTNAEQAESTREAFVSGVYSLIDLAFFVAFLGVVYQTAGSVMAEQNARLTPHLQAMGCMRSARILSWHFSMSMLYMPAWIAMAIIWQKRVFTNTPIGLVIGVNILFGVQITSWSMFAGMPFAQSPQLAAIATTFFALIFAIIAHVVQFPTGGACLFQLFFPSSFFIYALRGIALYEMAKIPTDALKTSPSDGYSPNDNSPILIIAVIGVAILNTFLWPILSLLLEHWLYGARRTKVSREQKKDMEAAAVGHSEVAVRIETLHKKFGRGKKGVIAINDLSLTIPKYGIHCLLGSNGSGKSTTLEILAGLISASKGVVSFGGQPRPARGTLGIVPQKNVLWDELSCLQHLKLWRDIKRPIGNGADEDLVQLLRDCDVGTKVKARASTLSGGQKRKLQLAVGLVGQSELILVDEATSGVDPLARRAIWRALNAVKAQKTIVYTTHFLDEADLIGDEITILAAPGKLLASGSPVKLKSTLGDGYVVNLHRANEAEDEKLGQIWDSHSLMAALKAVTPGSHMTLTSEGHVIRLNTKEPADVARALRVIEDRKADLGIIRYDVHASSLEDIFLGLMQQEEHPIGPAEIDEKSAVGSTPTVESISAELEATPIALNESRPVSFLTQAWIIFGKRFLVLKRGWLSHVIMIAIACCGALIPLFFMKDRSQTCARSFDDVFYTNLFFPESYLEFEGGTPFISPPTALSSLGVPITFNASADNATFFNDIITYQASNLSIGGVSFAGQSGQTVVAWEADPLSTAGFSMLNLATNVFYNEALNSSTRGIGLGPQIYVSFVALPPTSFGGTGDGVKWVAFFGLAMGVFPAFFTLYTARERRTSVQAMGYSNGLTPLGLWLGHLLFEIPSILIISSIISLVFAFGQDSSQFYSTGVLWVVLTLYGMASALFSFCVSMFITSGLAAFALVAGYQVILFLLYTAAYLLTLTFQLSANNSQTLTTVHFTMALLSPVVSVVRAAFVSINLFNLLCTGTGTNTTTGPGDILKYGGPILYLILYSVFCFGLLVGVDSGFFTTPQFLRLLKRRVMFGATTPPERETGADVLNEAKRVQTSRDALRVLGISKHFASMTIPAVDDVSFGVNDERMALLGPNGAGKTTTFNMIRGSIRPDRGNVFISGHSILSQRNYARVSLGVCPQFNAIDDLTVRQHLLVYGRFRGLKGAVLKANVEAILDGAHLRIYEHRLAAKLSGGNQRKLSLAISLVGNPKVVLIDEWSAGVDAATKRQMWHTLRRATAGKAVVLTTHSMEEASALANRVGIIASKMLAIDTVPQLCSRYAVYEVHLSARTAAQQARARELIANAFPDAKQAEDVSTRFEVALEDRTLADLFERLALVEAQTKTDEEGLEYTVERLGLESVFLKVVRGDRDGRLIGEEANLRQETRRRRFCGLF